MSAQRRAPNGDIYSGAACPRKGQCAYSSYNVLFVSSLGTIVSGHSPLSLSDTRNFPESLYVTSL